MDALDEYATARESGLAQWKPFCRDAAGGTMFEGQVLHSLATGLNKMGATEMLTDCTLRLAGNTPATDAVTRLTRVLLQRGANAEDFPWWDHLSDSAKRQTRVKPDLLVRSQHIEPDVLSKVLHESAQDLAVWNPSTKQFDAWPPVAPATAPFAAPPAVLPNVIRRVAIEITMSGSANGVKKIAQLERALWCCGNPTDDQVAVLFFNSSPEDFKRAKSIVCAR